MSEFKVFYSWQSDLPASTNRTFIGEALARACDKVSKNPNIEESPRLDQDTQGVLGSPAIPATIMEKIDECQVFVADVSLCFSGPNGKVAPNPNVTYEVGYAVARLGWERIILVMNLEHGPIESLPFDLEKRRVTGPYRAKVGENDRSAEKLILSSKLAAGIEAIARVQSAFPMRSPAVTAIDAIKDQRPERNARTRDFWNWTLAELLRIQPDLQSSPPMGKHVQEQIAQLETAIEDSGEVARLWSNVCEAIALANDLESAKEITRGFGTLLEEYDHKAGYTGTFYVTYFDYWKFVGYELWTVWIGSLLKERRWALIDETLGWNFYWEAQRERTNHGIVHFDQFSDFVHLLDQKSKASRRLSIHADILKARYESESIGSTLSWLEFMDADFFLFLAGELRLEAGWSDLPRWRPWSVLYMKHKPPFLTEAVSKRTAADLKSALGEQDSSKIRELLKERVSKLRALWQGSIWCSPVTDDLIDAFDTR